MLLSATGYAQYGPLQQITPNSPQVMDVAVGDIDGDEDVDVVVASKLNGAVIWYENDGSGIFSVHHDVCTFVPDERLLELIDLNSDGHLDIFLGRSDELGIPGMTMINQGNGTFVDQSQSYANILNASDPVKMEMDADGLLDLLDGLIWYKNLGGGQFGAPDTLPMFTDVTSAIYNYRIIDVNNDQQPEVFYRINSDSIGYSFNLGESQDFELTVVPFNVGGFVDPLQAYGDFDGDGDIDLLVVEDLPSPDYRQAWLENDGTGHFTEMHSMGLNQHFYGNDHLVAVNLDQSPEYEIADFDYIPLFYGLVDTNIVTYGQIVEMTMHGIGSGIFADFNNDGMLDVLFTSGLSVWLNDGTLNGWSQSSFLDNPSSAKYFKLANMDEDGGPDIVATSYKGVITIEVLKYLGNGEYAHRSEVVEELRSNIRYLYTEDYNFDGRLDIGYDEYYNTSFNTIINDWSSFTNIQAPFEDTTIANEHSVAADFDGDQDIDVITIDETGLDTEIFLYRNENGSYLKETIGNTSENDRLQWPEAVDIEGDGDLDVVFLNTGELSWGVLPGITVLTNNGSGHFDIALYSNPLIDDYYHESFSHADIDNDGDIDFVVGSSLGEANIIVFEYDFDHYVDHIIPVDLQYYAFKSTTADVDNDGALDILCFTGSIQNDGSTGLFWYRNEGDMSFDGPYFQPYTEPYLNEIDAAVVTLVERLESLDRDGDGDTDLFLSCLHSGSSIYYLENLFWGSYRISGHLFMDADTSGSLTGADFPFQFLSVDITPSQSSFYTTPNGIYNAIVNPGTLTVTPDFDTALWILTTPQSSYTLTVDSANSLVTDIDFGVIPNGVQPGAQIHMTEPAGQCTSTANIWVSVQNTGNTILSGVVEVVIDSILTIVQVPQADSIVGNSIYFSVDSLWYYDLQQWPIQIQLPDFNFLGVTSVCWASYQDGLNYFVSDTATGLITCAYDPNDKLETTGEGTEKLIDDGQWLEYTVRFQNTGNASATDVVIRDQFSHHLDWSTFTPISWSHDVIPSVEPDGDAVFRFDNIMLPDSGADYHGSQGFITYRIKADSNLIPGTLILNEARIFFDNNPPVITNTTKNKVKCYNVPEQQILWDGLRLRSPFLLPIGQQWYLNGSPIPNATEISFTPIYEGTYYTVAVYPGDCEVQSEQYWFEGTGISESSQPFAKLYPNPTTADFTVQLALLPRSGSELVITNILGVELYRTNKLGNGVVHIPKDNLLNGVILVYLIEEGTRMYLGKEVLLGH